MRAVVKEPTWQPSTGDRHTAETPDLSAPGATDFTGESTDVQMHPAVCLEVFMECLVLF